MKGIGGLMVLFGAGSFVLNMLGRAQEAADGGGDATD